MMAPDGIPLTAIVLVAATLYGMGVEIVPDEPKNDPASVSAVVEINCVTDPGQSVTIKGEITGAGGVGLRVNTAVAVHPVAAAV